MATTLPTTACFPLKKRGLSLFSRVPLFPLFSRRRQGLGDARFEVAEALAGQQVGIGFDRPRRDNGLFWERYRSGQQRPDHRRILGIVGRSLRDLSLGFLR
jgi:hypothetical protein